MGGNNIFSAKYPNFLSTGKERGVKGGLTFLETSHISCIYEYYLTDFLLLNLFKWKRNISGQKILYIDIFIEE